MRTQRACHQCARAKSKCDFQQPCARCKRRSTDCDYDPVRSYEGNGIFGVTNQAVCATAGDVASVSLIQSPHVDAVGDGLDEVFASSSANGNGIRFGDFDIDLHLLGSSQPQFQAASIALATDGDVCNSPPLVDHQSILGLEELASLDFDFSRLQDCTTGWDAMALSYDVMRPFEAVCNPPIQVINSIGGNLHTNP